MSGKWQGPRALCTAAPAKTRGRENGRLRLSFARKGTSRHGRHIRLTCEMGRFEWTTPDSVDDGSSLGPDEAPERHRRCTSLHPLTHSHDGRQISVPPSAFDVLRAALKPIVHSFNATAAHGGGGVGGRTAVIDRPPIRCDDDTRSDELQNPCSALAKYS